MFLYEHLLPGLLQQFSNGFHAFLSFPPCNQLQYLLPEVTVASPPCLQILTCFTVLTCKCSALVLVGHSSALPLLSLLSLYGSDSNFHFSNPHSVLARHISSHEALKVLVGFGAVRSESGQGVVGGGRWAGSCAGADTWSEERSLNFPSIGNEATARFSWTSDELVFYVRSAPWAIVWETNEKERDWRLRD